MSIRNYWFAFAIGVAAGAGVALLYAPQTGASTRKKLKSQLDNAGDYLDDAGGYLKTQAGRVGSEAQAAYQQGKKQVESAVDAAADLANNAVKSAKSLV